MHTVIAAHLMDENSTDFLPQLREQKLPAEQRRAIVREGMKRALLIEDRLGLLKGEILYEIAQEKYWKEWTFKTKGGVEKKFETFDEYIENELDYSRSHAYQTLRIYETFVVKLGIPADELKDLEWSKVAEIVKIVTPENWEEMLEKCRTTSLRDIKEFVKARRKPGSITAVSSTDGINKTFKLFPEQAENLRAALEVARALSDSDKEGHLLDIICTDFLAGAAGSDDVAGILGKLDLQLQNLERCYGVKLEIKSLDRDKLLKEDA